MANEMLEFRDTCVDMYAQLAGEARLTHRYSEPIEEFKILADQVEALEATEHVIDR